MAAHNPFDAECGAFLRGSGLWDLFADKSEKGKCGKEPDTDLGAFVWAFCGLVLFQISFWLYHGLQVLYDASDLQGNASDAVSWPKRRRKIPGGAWDNADRDQRLHGFICIDSDPVVWNDLEPRLLRQRLDMMKASHKAGLFRL